MLISCSLDTQCGYFSRGSRRQHPSVVTKESRLLPTCGFNHLLGLLRVIHWFLYIQLAGEIRKSGGFFRMTLGARPRSGVYYFYPDYRGQNISYGYLYLAVCSGE